MSLRCQYHFGIAGDFDSTDSLRSIREFGSAHLQIILRRNTYHRVHLDLLIDSTKLGPRLSEDSFVFFCDRGRRLPGRRPESFAIQVSDIAKVPPAITRRILAPTCDRESSPATVTTPCARDRNMVLTIGQEMHFRHGCCWVR